MARTKVRTRAVIPISLPTDVGRLIAKAATLKGQPLSVFVRESAHAAAERVIAEHRDKPAVASA